MWSRYFESIDGHGMIRNLASVFRHCGLCKFDLVESDGVKNPAGFQGFDVYMPSIAGCSLDRQ